MKIKVGDNVIIIAGKDKGKIGLVQSTNPEKDLVVVEGVNIRTIHIKPTQQSPEGGIEQMEKPIHVSNVMINIGDVKNPDKAIGSKISFKVTKNKNGKKDKKRIAKANGEEI